MVAFCLDPLAEATMERGEALALQGRFVKACREVAALQRRVIIAEVRMDGSIVAATGPGCADRGPGVPAAGVAAPSGTGGAGGSLPAPIVRMDYAAALKAGITPAADAARGGTGVAAGAVVGQSVPTHEHVAFLTPMATPARDVLRLLKTNIDPHAKNIKDLSLHHTRCGLTTNKVRAHLARKAWASSGKCAYATLLAISQPVLTTPVTRGCSGKIEVDTAVTTGRDLLMAAPASDRGSGTRQTMEVDVASPG
ncbi:hypothetical protein HPB49_025354 [Dermacentor silvarum]|uniref:Uncharacterized protein n=1 Tax=Dermacentor silvarum TaxID=543639 RepID=A0ACB8CIR5_DERSI|nr:hypothetical protein HPB49_025354 [Dermacentor silvarum]